MNFYILILKNKLSIDLSQEIEKFKTWIVNNTPLEPIIEVIETNFSNEYASFVKNDRGGFWFGQSGIKEKIRNSGQVKNGAYHEVMYVYNSSDFVSSDTKNDTANFTYPNPLYDGTSFCEISMKPWWDNQDHAFYRISTHETLHCWHRLCWWSKFATKDTMDVYDKEFEIEAKDGNRARNLIELAGYWTVIAKQTKLVQLANLLSALASSLALLLKLKTEKSKLEKWAEAIKEYEGWSVGSRSYRNNNPGNLKYVGQVLSTGADSMGFAIFKSYKDGWDTLLKMLKNAATGLSSVYRPENSLFVFFSKFSPAADNNDPGAYALFVSHKIGVVPSVLIKELV